MKKRALLIGAAGGGTRSQYLHGVEADLHNMREHLISPKGGGWQDHEVIILDNPAISQINLVFNDLNADFTQIYFTGHGSTDENGRRILHLSNGQKFADKDFLKLRSTRLLITVDACRVYLPSDSGLGFLGEAYSHFDGDSSQLLLARKLYNYWIKNTMPGRLIVHSTDRYNSALDLGTGGVFTSSLLDYASRLRPNGNKCTIADIINICSRAASSISKNGYSQRPTIVYKQGNIKLPFAMGLPEFVFTSRSPFLQKRVNLL